MKRQSPLTRRNDEIARGDVAVAMAKGKLVAFDTWSGKILSEASPLKSPLQVIFAQ